MRLHLPTDGHLAAHAGDFRLPLEDVIARVAARIPADAPVSEPFRVEVRCTTPVGRSRCVSVAGRRTWWGYREGRSIPSHLAAGEPEDTPLITAWLRKRDEESADVLTVYPGPVAPREPGDPDLPESEREASAAFWSHHALLAPEPGAIWLVNALSLNMLGGVALGAVADLRVRRVPLEHARLLAQHAGSAVGHADTAAQLAMALGRDVPCARRTLCLGGGDCLIVGQYVGERLPEGTSALPGGANIAWYWVEVGRGTR